MRRALSVVVVLMLSAVAWGQTPAPAAGARDEARAHFAAGESLFKAGDYQGAIKEFHTADRLVPSPILTYNVALSYDKLGDAGRAIPMYRQYLDRRPDAPNRALVESRITALTGFPAPPPPVAAAPPVPAPDGDALAAPRNAVPPSGEPRKREYDDSFARRLPSSNGATGAAAAPGGDAEQAPPPAPIAEGPVPLPPAPEAPRSEDKPLYKQWWFWAIVGVGAIIVVDVAVNAGSSDSGARGVSRAPAGVPLFSF